MPVRQCRRASRRKPGRPSVAATSPRRDVAPAVALAGEREDRVRADVDAAVDAAREVHAEERVARVGHRVEQPADEVLALRARAGRYSPRKGTMRGSASSPASARDPVGLQARRRRRAGRTRARRPRRRRTPPAAAAMPVDRAPSTTLAARGDARRRAKARATARKSVIAVVGECSAGDAGRVRLDLAQLVGRRASGGPGTPFALRAPLELAEPRDLGVVDARRRACRTPRRGARARRSSRAAARRRGGRARP